MDIDFVIPWVDGNDPVWIEEFNKYAPKKKNLSIDVLAERYRDNGLLRYWFRGIEKNAPWVRKIFFVSSGQKPEWLNLKNEKLHWIKHEDYIPHEYLPVFSSRVIHIYLHQIKGLSENFVLFDDDMYILNPVRDDFFFRKGLPRDHAIFRPLKAPGFYEHVIINDLIEINNFFNKYEALRKNPLKYYNLKYSPLNFLHGYYFSRSRDFPGFLGNHFPQPFLKKTFGDVWQHCGEVLSGTSNNRFRSIADVNSYLFRYWQLAGGNFTPQVPFKQKKYYDVMESNIDQIGKSIGSNSIKELCLNDSDCPDECYQKLLNYFEKKFPAKSSFEL